LQKPNEARIGIFAFRFTEHFAKHVKDPGAFSIDQDVETVGVAGRIETAAERQAANVGGRDFRVAFFQQPLAIAVQPDALLVVGQPLAIGEKDGEVAGKSFVNPLVAIAVPAHDVAPPLMGDFMEGNQIVKVFLTTGRKAGTLLSGGREVRVRGKIEQAGPALAEGARYLRNAELTNGEWTGIRLVEVDRGVDVAGQLLQCVGGAGLRKRQGQAFRGNPSALRSHARDIKRASSIAQA